MSVRFNFNPRRWVFGIQWTAPYRFLHGWRDVSLFIGPIYWQAHWQSSRVSPGRTDTNTPTEDNDHGNR